VSIDFTTETTPILRETILVVEGEVFVRMVISDYLRGCGYKVIEAANSDEALVVLQNPEIAIDVVFSSIEAPGSMDGFELSHWIRANRPGLDVLLAGSVPRAVSVAAELCDEGPLPKPYEPQVVVDRIRRLIAARAARRNKR
jgi:CheY-like chemotaxis protein